MGAVRRNIMEYDELPSVTDELNSSETAKVEGTIAKRALNYSGMDLLEIVFGASTMSLIWHMMPSTTNPAEATFRVPPRWTPEIESTYSFRTYSQDTLLWCVTTGWCSARLGATDVSS